VTPEAIRSAPGSRVLVIEDEPDIGALIAYQLTKAGYRVETAADGSSGLSAIRRAPPDLVVLDLMLPGLSGLEVLEKIREDPESQGLPVLILTAKRDPQDRIHGLEHGADDYLVKPFSPRELVLRVQAILRRSQGLPFASGGAVLRNGALVLDVGSARVKCGEVEIQLTPTEFRLLQALLEQPGRTLSRTQLLQRAWEVDGTVAERLQTRTVDMHVRRLRTKLGPEGEALETVRGFGYRFNPTDEVD